MNERMKSLFASIDRMDAEGFVSFLTKDASFRFANAPAAVGRENIRSAVKGFFSQIKGLRHSIIKVLESDDIIVSEGDVTYSRLDGKNVTIPFVNIFRMQGELVKDYRIYIDIAPLFA